MNINRHECIQEIIPASLSKLFHYCREHVDADCVARHCPNDPGYKAYVREWQGILQSGTMPSASNFEISETVGLTMWVDEECSADFLRFRCFTNSVALPLMCCAHEEVVFDLNYPLVRLLSDTIVLQDGRLLLLLEPAVESCFELCRQSPRYSAEFVPWCAYALTLVAACRGNSSEVSRWAAQTINLEAGWRHSEGGDLAASDLFLFGITSFNSLHPAWFALTELLLPRYRDCEPVALILDALASFCIGPKTILKLPLLNEAQLAAFRSGVLNPNN